MARLFVSMVLLGCAVWGIGPRGAAGAEPASAAARKVFADLRALFDGIGSRAPGSPGNLELETRVAKRFADSGFEHGSVDFRAPVFVPGDAFLAVGGRAPVRVRPMHPTLMRPGNFPEPKFETRLVYLGRGTYADLEAVRGVDLDGAVALMEFDCGDRWLRLLRFGLRGIVFIGSPDGRPAAYTDSVGKIYNTEVPVPRFFISAEEGAALRSLARPKSVPVVVTQPTGSAWQVKTLRDLWVLIPGEDDDLKKEVIVLTAPIDANSVVPGLATGAQSAGNLFLLLNLLEDLKAEAPSRTVMLVAVNAHTHNFLGERMLAWHLLAGSDKVEQVRYTTALEMRKMRLYTEMYRRLQLRKVEIDPEKLHVWMGVLWQLDAKQEEQRALKHLKLERKEGPKAEKAKRKRWERSGDGRVKAADLDALVGVEFEAVLDLSPFAEGDYQEAIDAAIQALEDERGGVLSKFTTDEAAIAGLAEDIERTRKLKSLSFDEMTTWANRVKTVFDDEKLLESWRIRQDGSAGVRLSIKEKLQDEAKRRLNRVKRKIQGLSQDLKKNEARLAELRRQQVDMTKVLVLFNKIDIGIGRSRVYYRQIAAHDVQLALLKDCRDTILSDFTERRATLERSLKMDSSNDDVRDALGKSRVKLAICLEMGWHADRFGFNSMAAGYAPWLQELGKVVAEIAEKQGDAGGEAGSPFVDAMSNAGGKGEAYFFNSLDSPAPAFHVSGAAAVALKSVFADQGAAFGPDDTFDRLDPARVFRSQAWLRSYMRALLADPALTAGKAIAAAPNAGKVWSVVLNTFTLDQYAGKVAPDVAIPRSLITLYSPVGKLQGKGPTFLIDGDVVNCYRGMTDATGWTAMYGVWHIETLASLAYQMDEDFRTLTYDLDKGQIQQSKRLNSNIFQTKRQTLPMFPCTEFIVYDRADPTLISDAPITAQNYWPMSAAIKGPAQKYGTHGVDCLSTAMSHVSRGPISVTLWRRSEDFKAMRLLLLTQEKRCALNATDEKPEGIGFESPEELGPDFYARVAVDMDKMNRKRRAEMKGVANELLADFLDRGAAALDEADEARKARDHNGFLLANYKALGGQTKSYGQIRSMNGDMLKAIVLYMALMIPFCFFVQKLLFGFKRLEFDMLAFVVLFSAIYAVFRFIHPAFRIALNPEAIFIAFVLGAIGCFVTWVLHKRFETEMQILFRNITGMEGDVAYSTVGQTAMMIGVNNMKRRRIRTSLTTATIVLVVFTMLAFSSVSKKMQPTFVHEADDSPYTGIFYHWPEGKPMDEDTVAALRDLYEGREYEGGEKVQVLVRRLITPPDPQLPIHLERGPTDDKPLGIEAVIGLAPEEDGFLRRIPLANGRYFSSAEAEEIILPGRAFEALKIPTDSLGKVTVHMLGRDLTLVGVMDDDRYRFMRDLDPNFPLLPRKPGQVQAQGAESEDVSALVVDTANVAFLPAGLATKLGGKPFTISIRFPAKADPKGGGGLWREASLMLDVTQARFHIGSKAALYPDPESKHKIDAGIYYIGSSYRTSIGGLQQLIIPLLIAGSIILNTMLGTVYERKYEIAVYNAVGLNPTHIFLFFLAEAFVYGVIGSVSGYLIGQVIAVLLKTFGLMQKINVNFSSLMVGYAIMFTIGLVLLSTIYPGIVATRTAVPSGKRKWSLPDHDGQRMNVVFPFIYQPALAAGVMHYLYEYFLTYTEQSIGDQVVALEELSAGTDAKGRETFRMQYGVALAPYDLGVTQTVTFTTHFDEVVDSYRVHMTVDRISGQDTNWVTTNKPFLEKLRKLLIRWRNIDPTQHSWYIEQGRKLFDAAKPSDGAPAA